MAEPGAFAYPVVLLSMYGVARVGRSQRWEELEWLRMGALATLFGMVLAVQARLVVVGATSHPLAIASAVVSLSGMALLIGIYLWERWQVGFHPLPRAAALAAD